MGARLPGSLSRGPSHAALGSEGPGARQPRVHELKPPRSLCARDSGRGASAAPRPGAGPSRFAALRDAAGRERGAFLCAFPSQVCSEARSGARRCRLALAGGGGRAPEQGRVAPLPGGFLFAALPGITSKERHGWRRQRVLFCDAFKESARLLVSMASFLVALHRCVAPRACAGAGPGAGRLPCPAGGMRVGSPCVSQRCGGLSVRAEGLCSVSVSRTICRARDRSFACGSTIPYLLTERLVRLLKITVWKRR